MSSIAARKTRFTLSDSRRVRRIAERPSYFLDTAKNRRTGGAITRDFNKSAA
jgi:hypothetical protein